MPRCLGHDGLLKASRNQARQTPNNSRAFTFFLRALGFTAGFLMVLADFAGRDVFFELAGFDLATAFGFAARCAGADFFDD